MRFILPLLVTVFLPLAAMAQDVMDAVRADHWADAQALAARHPDPVAAKLVTWFRLQAPGAATLAEINGFLAANPDWPLAATLVRRRDDIITAELDDGVAAAACDLIKPSNTPTQLRCAEALQKLGRISDAAALARTIWTDGSLDAAGEAKVLKLWGGAIRRDDYLRRFDRLAWSEPNAAARQLLRLAPEDRRLGEVRLALRRDEANARGLLNALPEKMRADPIIMLEQARWLRRNDQDDAALALWLASGTDAEKAAPPERQSAFWDERSLLARRRLRVGDAEGAYRLAAGYAQTKVEQIVDAEFLAGFIALRRLGNRELATKHFQTLADASKAAITQGRAQYWLGRAAGNAVVARNFYRAAAAFPNTFYGQLAALAAGETPQALAARLSEAASPVDSSQALDLAGRELARAAEILVSWGVPRRAAPFLLRLDEVAPDPATRDLTARLATGLGAPQVAVALARRSGRDGLVPLATGWPQAAAIPADAGIEPALALGIIRQESSFDVAITSPAGARGLMQLMPATAAQLGKKLGITVPLAALTSDPALNLRLGTAYLALLMAQFDNATPLVMAGYNAGPNRVTEWIGVNGDPRRGAIDAIDWIELIPFAETRNYVQRVTENMVIYRAQAGSIAPHPLAPWLP
jgi:soluble lytic murein transglycosylase